VVYRRLLNDLKAQGVASVHSQRLAELARGTAAQVRRDLMGLGQYGTPTHGYDVVRLLEGLREYLDSPKTQGIALVGIGHLGQAILSYFAGRRPRLAIQVAFDKAPARIDCTLHHCPCHSIDRLEAVLHEMNLKLAIVAVPAESAQEITDRLVKAGVRGLVNFAPAPLKTPENVFVENIDITTSIEKVAFFAMQRTRVGGRNRTTAASRRVPNQEVRAP